MFFTLACDRVQLGGILDKIDYIFLHRRNHHLHHISPLSVSMHDQYVMVDMRVHHRAMKNDCGLQVRGTTFSASLHFALLSYAGHHSVRP